MADKRDNMKVETVHRAGGTRLPARVAPVFTGIGIVTITARYAFSPHQHQEYEVILVDEGTYWCKLNGTEMALGRDEILVVGPGDWHEDVCDPPLRYFGVRFHFDPGLQGPVPLRLFVEGVAPERQHFRAERRDFWPLVQGIQDEAHVADAVAPQLQDALLLEFFWRLVRALPQEAVSTRFLDLALEQSFPTQLTRLFQTHVNETLSVADMADRLHMSESSLSHKCRDLMGESPARLFLKHKLDRARALLGNSSMTVKEIAARLGFDDPYHFSKAFKKAFGYPPSQGR